MIELADPIISASLVAKLASLATLVTCAEYIVRPSVLCDDGLMSWEVARVRERWLCAGLSGRVLHMLLGYPRVVGLLWLRVVLALVMIAAPMIWTVWPLGLALSAALGYLWIIRSRYGHDGADQLCSIIFTALFIGSLAQSPAGLSAALWFIGFQVIHSYTASGLYKVGSRGWRDGSFLTSILGTEIYGSPRLGRLLLNKPILARLISRGVVFWESMIWIVLVLPAQVAAVLLLSTLVFHAANAYVMGLNTFLIAFAAGYPAIMFIILSRGF